MLHLRRPPTKTYVDTFTDSRRWAAVKPRAGDIIVTTPPKSGTTWTQGILAMLIAEDPEVDAQTSFKSPWIDFSMRPIDEVIARIEAQTHRRHLKSHTPLDGLPFWDAVHYITVYRHPIDVYFSFRKHAFNQSETISKSFFPPEYFSDDPAEGFAVFLTGDFQDAASLSAIVEHYKCTLAHERRQNLLRLHYADMLQNLAKAVESIAGHAQLTPTSDLLNRVTDAARFENMQANAHRFTPSAGTGNWKNDSAFFDSASSNKWEGRLRQPDLVAYAARMDALLSPAERMWLEHGGLTGA